MFVLKMVWCLAVALVLASCAHVSEKMPGSGMLFSDHELAGKIWDVKNKVFVEQVVLKQAVLAGDYILLGETHDNPVHHQGQAWVIGQLASSQRSGLVAFEMIAQQQESFMAGKYFDSVDALISALGHVKSNWDYEQFYRSVFVSTLDAGYQIFAANMDRQKIMSIARKGEQEIPDNIKRRMDDAVLPEEQVAESRKEIEESHCGIINEQMTVAMMLVQRAKDASMAESLMAPKNIDARVLVAGSGHVRSDRGVPLYLQTHAEAKKVLTIAWAEVQPDAANAEDYTEHWGGSQLPFDYVWFTARVDRPDPCEAFRQHMKNREQSESQNNTSS